MGGARGDRVAPLLALTLLAGAPLLSLVLLAACPRLSEYRGLSALDCALASELLVIRGFSLELGTSPRTPTRLLAGALGARNMRAIALSAAAMLLAKCAYELHVGHAIFAPDLGPRVKLLPLSHMLGILLGALAVCCDWGDVSGLPAERSGVRFPRMLPRFLESKTEIAYALLRVVSGLMFSFHGMQKLFGVYSDFQPPAGSQLWIGAIIELVTGIAIAIGVLTPWAAFLASGTMFVAYVQFHWKMSFGGAFFPAVNKGELALLYCVVFFFVACRGAGPWSVDARRPARPSKAR